MPVHWYYNRSALYDDYGWVADYVATKNPHPDSILFRSSYVAANPKGEILHDQAPYWGREGTHYHYHQFLKPGENTLNLKLCSLLIQSLNACGRYDADDYLRRYIAFMTHSRKPPRYLHRGMPPELLQQLCQGVPPRKCGEPEKHIGAFRASSRSFCIIIGNRAGPGRQRSNISA